MLRHSTKWNKVKGNEQRLFVFFFKNMLINCYLVFALLYSLKGLERVLKGAALHVGNLKCYLSDPPAPQP